MFKLSIIGLYPNSMVVGPGKTLILTQNSLIEGISVFGSAIILICLKSIGYGERGCRIKQTNSPTLANSTLFLTFSIDTTLQYC